MTDEQIIKALVKHIDRAETCKYGATKSVIVNAELLGSAVELICRQQEKINHFVEANKMVVESKTVETDKTEDEILKRLLTQRVEFIPNNKDIKDIQRDAVINFAERLKRMMFITDYDIDDLVNKMFPKGSDTE